MAYIEKEKTLKYLEENNTADEWIIGQYNADWIYSFIESQPTADVVEVVRCKDCKYLKHDTEFMTGRFCYLRQANGGRFCEDNDFCSYGERRTGDG